MDILNPVHFGIILTQFYNNFFEIGTSNRTLIGLNQLLRFSGFSLYSPSFFLYSPFKRIGNIISSEPLLKRDVCPIHNGILDNFFLFKYGLDIHVFVCKYCLLCTFWTFSKTSIVHWRLNVEFFFHKLAYISWTRDIRHVSLPCHNSKGNLY